MTILDEANILYEVEKARDELRARMGDELDYRLEAENQTEFAAAFAGHPSIRVPAVIPAFSRRRVLTTEWVDGLSWDQLLAVADSEVRDRAGETIWRFAQRSVHLLRGFNGDPHPGNYRFAADGTVTFLDFGLVKRWTAGEWDQLAPSLDAIVVHRDPERLVAAMEVAGFLRPGHALGAQAVYDYVSTPYQPYLSDEFTFTRDFVRTAMQRITDIKGPHAAVIEQLNMPASFVILDRVVWGVSALLGKLEITRPWRAMLLEYRVDAPPATELGAAEAAWWEQRRGTVDRRG
jgi:predicted unusual protein kinase regulating ubiquinone biosynthesis (AarF/ABC1/UbiB family)